MKSATTLGKTAARLARYACMAILLNGLGALGLWPGANCWAQQNVMVYPGQNVQAAVNQYPGGTTFTLAPGIYYYTSIVPKSYDSFVGQPGAILSGATLLQNFSQSGAYWTAQVWFGQASSYPGYCTTASTLCTFPQDLFFNNVLKTRVSSLAAVGPGTWYYDPSSGTVYMGDYPWGSTVELSVLPTAFYGNAANVSIRTLTIEKYACAAGSGAVNGGGGSNYWEVAQNEVRFNHAFGVLTGDGMYVHDNYLHTNGEVGIGGRGTNITIQNNEIAWNNYAGYSIYNEAGGAKFSSVSNLTFRYNYVHDNMGPGFWTDLGSQYVYCDSNRFTANQIAAVLLELSDTQTVSNNYVWNDGYNPAGPDVWWGSGILISDSTNVSVYFNTVVNCMNGITGLLANRGNAPNGQPYSLKNVNVNSNWITQNSGIAAGIAIEGAGFDNSVYTSWNNQFQYNTFTLANPSAGYFYWMGWPMSMAQWHSLLGL